jgi:hypothetical protein
VLLCGEFWLKFKIIFIFSNVILLAFFLLIFLLPMIALGPRSALIFWQKSWLIGIFLLLILLAMNLFFALNFRLYYLLEREDWPALVRYLEKRIIEKGRYRSLWVRLLANSYIILLDNEALANLENSVAAAKPALFETLGLVFGAGRILGKDYTGATRFFEDRLAALGTANAALGTANAALGTTNAFWLSWYSGFAQLLNYHYEAASDRFSELARTAKDPVVTALAAWFLRQTLAKALPERSDEFAALAAESRKRAKGLLPDRLAWEKKMEKMRDEIHAVMVSRYLQDTADWLYK